MVTALSAFNRKSELSYAYLHAIASHAGTTARPGRVKRTRELVVKPNYIVVYRVTERVEVLRVRHAHKLDRQF